MHSYNTQSLLLSPQPPPLFQNFVHTIDASLTNHSHVIQFTFKYSLYHSVLIHFFYASITFHRALVYQFIYFFKKPINCLIFLFFILLVLLSQTTASKLFICTALILLLSTAVHNLFAILICHIYLKHYYHLFSFLSPPLSSYGTHSQLHLPFALTLSRIYLFIYIFISTRFIHNYYAQFHPGKLQFYL